MASKDESGGIIAERDGPVTIISIDRPARRNAVDGATAAKLFDAFTAFEADDTAAVAVLTGAGGTFCAGADLKALSEEDMAARLQPGGPGTMGPMGPTRLRLSKPVIAAIEGHAVAGGMELALWADLRVMAENAIFGVFCRRFGVPLIDLGTVRLPRLIGQSRAMDLILTGRPVEAREAHEIGLANRVTPAGAARAEAVALAHALARFPQACMRNDRLSVLEQWDIAGDGALANEYRRGMETVATGETLTGVGSFVGGTGRHGAF